MAHPNKKDSAAAHTAKLRRMTADYGSADPSMNKLAPVDAEKEEGDEDAVGFGSDSSAASAKRGDRPARRTTAANPLSTYRKGGRVRHGAKKRAEGGDVSSIEEANRNQAMTRTAERARGGRTKHKGSTHVNVIVAPQGAGAGAMPPPVLPVGGPPGLPPGLGAGPPPGMPPGMPPHPPMGGPMPPPGLMGAPGAPGGIPPGLMPPRAKGGRVKHADEAEDKALFKKMLKEEDRKESGHEAKRARGGSIKSIHDMDAGAMSGEGRLQKIELQKHQGKMKSQTV